MHGDQLSPFAALGLLVRPFDLEGGTFHLSEPRRQLCLDCIGSQETSLLAQVASPQRLLLERPTITHVQGVRLSVQEVIDLEKESDGIRRFGAKSQFKRIRLVLLEPYDERRSGEKQLLDNASHVQAAAEGGFRRQAAKRRAQVIGHFLGDFPSDESEQQWASGSNPVAPATRIVSRPRLPCYGDRVLRQCRAEASPPQQQWRVLVLEERLHVADPFLALWARGLRGEGEEQIQRNPKEVDAEETLNALREEPESGDHGFLLRAQATPLKHSQEFASHRLLEAGLIVRDMAEVAEPRVQHVQPLIG
ncbi:MAG: hypothetical protein GY769_16910 [bacterium]|nr:hypothetical protein [bacterium]